jgi:hypothetical protein
VTLTGRTPSDSRLACSTIIIALLVTITSAVKITRW